MVGSLASIGDVGDNSTINLERSQRMTQTDLQQDTLQDVPSEKDAGVWCVERAAVSLYYTSF